MQRWISKAFYANLVKCITRSNLSHLSAFNCLFSKDFINCKTKFNKLIVNFFSVCNVTIPRALCTFDNEVLCNNRMAQSIT